MNDKEKLRKAFNLRGDQVKMSDKEKIELVLKMIEDTLEAEYPTIWTVEDHKEYLKVYLNKIKDFLKNN